MFGASSLSFLAVLGQTNAAAAPATAPPSWLLWLIVWGNPSLTVQGLGGGMITWLKVVGIFCLVGWVTSWLIASLKQPRRDAPTFGILDMGAIAGLLFGILAVVVRVMVDSQRLPAGLGQAPTILGILAVLALFLWVEARMWGVLMRLGKGADRLLLLGLHLSLGLGFLAAFVMDSLVRRATNTPSDLVYTLTQGARMGVTFGGLLVFVRVLMLVLPEVWRIRSRRLYAIAWHSWTEAFRRMWAPWVVLVLFAVILAFTSWFLQPSDAQIAELSRLYIAALLVLSSVLITVAIVIMAPISMPHDISQQTIYTVVSKPVRRLELIWGRMLGFMALVTMLVLLIGGVSLLYFHRQIGAAERQLQAQARTLEQEGNTAGAQKALDDAAQLRSRMTARQPVNGSLMFFDSRNNPRRRGIDVGMDVPRSFVEGATPARAIWTFGAQLEDPTQAGVRMDRSVPIDQFLKAGTIESLQDQLLTRRDELAFAQQKRNAPDLKTGEITEVTAQIARLEPEVARLQKELETLLAREKELLAQDTDDARQQARKLRSPGVPVEVTFTVFRTTKGVVGEPVYAQMVVTNPRPGSTPYRDVFPVREYYTIQRELPASVLAGSRGELSVEIRCMSPNQYLGMNETDLYLLASQGTFWVNYLKGLGGVWLQAMVLTAVGVFAGTFLSWPMALLLTIFFFLAGNLGFSTLQEMALSNELLGGGPFEALLRTLTHENLVSELEATPPVVVARTCDAVVVPVLSRLVYVVPNLNALDVSNTVSSGFAVVGSHFLRLVLLSLAYALPFSIAGYFILKNREVAA